MNTKVKTVLIVVAIIIVVVIMTWGIMKLTGASKKIDDKLAEQKLSDIIDSEISNHSLSELEATTYAQKLYTAMKGLGTDEEAIYEVFSQLRSYSDILYLMKVFGVKDRKTLAEWLTAELNSKERQKLNDILSEKGIAYKF